MSEQLRVFRRYDAVVAESIVVIGDDIVWCDITRGQLRRSPIDGAVDGSDDVVVHVNAPLCSFHPAESGFVVSGGDRVAIVDEQGRSVRILATIEHAGPHMRLNEGKVDPVGRWVTGSMDTQDARPIGAFYSVTADGRSRTIMPDIGTANGLEWSPDGSRIYFTDTSTGTIYTGNYDSDGDISDVDVFHAGCPHDGLVMDTKGEFWGALFGEGRIVHLNADGRESGAITLPVPNLTSVAFAATTLYIGSARETLTSDELVHHPLSGSIFAVDLDVTAAPPRIFPG